MTVSPLVAYRVYQIDSKKKAIAFNTLSKKFMFLEELSAELLQLLLDGDSKRLQEWLSRNELTHDDVDGFIRKLCEFGFMDEIPKPTDDIDAQLKLHEEEPLRGSLNLLSLASAVVEIPQENIPHYAECNENWLRYVIDHDTGREIVQEQAEFRDWHNNYISFLQDSPLEIDVGLFFVMRLLEMITAPYVCASKKSICNILSKTGKVHLSSVCAKGRNEYRDRAEYKGWLLGWRAAYNDLLHTTSHAATGMLLTLTIPKTLSQKEFKYVLLRVYGYADEFVDFFFNVQVTSSKSDAIYAKVLATGTWDENEEH